MQGGLAQILRVVMPFMSLIFMYFQPGTVQLFFVTTSALALCQTVAFTTPRIRSMLGMYPMPLPKESSGGDTEGAGGLRTYQDPTASQGPGSGPTGQKDVSIIDRVVDSAKARKDKMFKGYRTTTEAVWGKAEDKVKSRQKEAFIKRAEAYEASQKDSKRRLKEWQKEMQERRAEEGSQGGDD